MRKQGPKIPKPKLRPSTGGRPAIAINWELVDYLASIRCTAEEISGACGCDHETLRRHWAKRKSGVALEQHLDEKRALGRASLRRKQFEIAMSGNVTMLIWLGKQLLDQKDERSAIPTDLPSLPIGSGMNLRVVIDRAAA